MMAKLSFPVRSQVVTVLSFLLILNPVAQGKNSKLGNLSFKPSYKAEKCDCIGYSDDIPTFLTDLAGGQIEIFGEGSTQEAAILEARKMCVESYRNFASVSKQSQNEVTESGCQIYRTTMNGDWESL